MNATAKTIASDPETPHAWTIGNGFHLLENGDEYFPAVFAAIAAAEREVLIETFILFEDAVGKELQRVLISAAHRGVRVDLTIDDYGTPNLSPHYMEQLTQAGVRLHIFDPSPRFLGVRTNVFRRLHRKIVSIDARVAFVGGINFGADQLLSFGEKAKQDYAVQLTGPIAKDVHRFAQQQAAAFYRHQPWWAVRLSAVYHHWAFSRRAVHAQAGRAMLVTRDNRDHRDDIERQYREAIYSAQRDVLIACAYFFPGYRLLRQLRRAARRGVAVRLLLQGNPDVPQAKTWARLLYPSLLEAGVEIYEYCERPLHAKVAVVDYHWSTVGSSNLDPLSLALNLEANVVVRDYTFNAEIRDRLEPLLQRHCKRMDRYDMQRGSLWQLMGNFVAYHCTRHFPTWVGWLPAHMPKRRSLEPKPQLMDIGKFSRGFGVPRDPTRS